MMVKEHITESYGVIEAVVGTNGSGAALQQYTAANNAPGLISAAMPTATFADIATTAMTVADRGLLQHYYDNTDREWTAAPQATVDGQRLLQGAQVHAICQSLNDTFIELHAPPYAISVPARDRHHPTE